MDNNQLKATMQNMLSGINGMLGYVEGVTKQSMKDLTPEDAEKMKEQLRVSGLSEKMNEVRADISKLENAFNNLK